MKNDVAELIGIPTDEGFENLKAAYSHAHSQTHILRDRIAKISAAALGIMLLADAWFIAIATKQAYAPRIRFALVGGIIVILLAAAYSCYAHAREYVYCWRTIKRLEVAMGFYTNGVYFPSESLYVHDKWRYRSNFHFINAYIASLIVFAAASVSLILLL